MLIRGESDERERWKVLPIGKIVVRAAMVMVVVSVIENVAIPSRRSIRLSIVRSAGEKCDGGVQGMKVTLNDGNGFT
jgi:hypothetical protein